MVVESRALQEAPRAAANLAETFCIPFLLASQNDDGGWGYQPGSESGVEATSWALLALGSQARIEAGLEWLRRTQLPDGSWPAFRGQKQGCWTTALACLALLHRGDPAERDRLERGVHWLLSSWPAEGRLWRRIRNWVFSGSAVVRQNNSLRGWSWTPATASWVEPTSYTLILLRSLTHKLQAMAAKRMRLAESMLCDRVCPDGGWNSGNPLVYGVAGEPRVGPTAWALLALRNHCDQPLIHSSLDWLGRAYGEIQGPRSLALVHMCLAAYGRPVAPLEPALRSLYSKNGFLRSVPAVAMATIALRGSRVLSAAPVRCVWG